MNLKTVIPVCLTIIVVASVVGIILNEYVDEYISQPCPPLCGDVWIDPRLDTLLSDCEAQKSGEYVHLNELDYSNDTHHIDNTECVWHTINESEEEPYPGYNIKQKALGN